MKSSFFSNGESVDVDVIAGLDRDDRAARTLAETDVAADALTLTATIEDVHLLDGDIEDRLDGVIA